MFLPHGKNGPPKVVPCPFSMSKPWDEVSSITFHKASLTKVKELFFFSFSFTFLVLSKSMSISSSTLALASTNSFLCAAYFKFLSIFLALFLERVLVVMEAGWVGGVGKVTAVEVSPASFLFWKYRSSATDLISPDLEFALDLAGCNRPAFSLWALFLPKECTLWFRFEVSLGLLIEFLEGIMVMAVWRVQMRLQGLRPLLL